MGVVIENIRGPVARNDWGDGNKKFSFPLTYFAKGTKSLYPGTRKDFNIFSQGRKIQPQISHCTDLGNYLASVDTGQV